MKIAIVHDYLHQYGGAEKVVEKWLQMYPKADIYTALYTPETFKDSKEISEVGRNKRIHTSFAQKLIANKVMIRFFKHFFWLYPLTMSRLKVKNYDVVLISSTYCGKNIKLENCNKVIHYCHSPTRFLHGLVTETDHKTLSKWQRIIIPFFKFWLKRIDLNAVKYLNKKGCVWIGNSNFIVKTIKDVYDVEAQTIYPPIELKEFLKIERKPKNQDEFYLCHGRISFHKRIDLAIRSCLKMGRKLKISGSSSFPKEMDELKKIVREWEDKNPRDKGLIEFLGRTSFEQYYNLLAECQGFIFPGKEDFGIAPIEVLASGTPLIAYQAGGALEYIKNGENGIFFPEQTTASLVNAIQAFEEMNGWNGKKIKETSLKFSEEAFRNNIERVVKA